MRFTFPAQLTEGQSGPQIITTLAQWFSITEEIINLIQVNFEATVQGLFGKGILDQSWVDPLLSAGTGLALTVSPHTEINGFENIITADQSVPITANSTKYVWVLQNNETLFPSYALTDAIDQDPSDENTLALLLGSVTTNDTTITNITPLFSIVKPLSEYVPLVAGTYTPKENTFTLAWDADVNTRSGGTLFSVNLDWLQVPTAPLVVFRDNVRVLPTVGFTTATVGSVTQITFLDGWKPTTDSGVSETVTVDGYSAS